MEATGCATASVETVLLSGGGALLLLVAISFKLEALSSAAALCVATASSSLLVEDCPSVLGLLFLLLLSEVSGWLLLSVGDEDEPRRGSELDDPVREDMDVLKSLLSMRWDSGGEGAWSLESVPETAAVGLSSSLLLTVVLLESPCSLDRFLRLLFPLLLLPSESSELLGECSSESKLNPKDVLPMLTSAELSELLSPLELPLSALSPLRKFFRRCRGMPSSSEVFSAELSFSFDDEDMVVLVVI